MQGMNSDVTVFCNLKIIDPWIVEEELRQSLVPSYERKSSYKYFTFGFSLRTYDFNN